MSAPVRERRFEQLGTIAVAVALLLLAGRVAEQRFSSRRTDVGTTTTIVPSTPAEGLSWSPGAGQLLSVDTEPPGAALSIDGQAFGETPFASDFPASCTGEATLRLTRPGYAPATLKVPCRAGHSRVKLTLRKR